MVVEGNDGTRLGTVERFEIDAAGRVTNVVVRVSNARGACKRVAAKRIRAIHADILTLALSASEIMRLGDATARIPDELLLESVHFYPDVR